MTKHFQLCQYQIQKTLFLAQVQLFKVMEVGTQLIVVDWESLGEPYMFSLQEHQSLGSKWQFTYFVSCHPPDLLIYVWNILCLTHVIHLHHQLW